VPARGNLLAACAAKLGGGVELRSFATREPPPPAGDGGPEADVEEDEDEELLLLL